MKRVLLGEGQFAESVLGRIALVALYAVAWSLSLMLLFLLDWPFNPIVLKFLVLALIGLGTGLVARRLLAESLFAVALFALLLAEVLALSLLNPLTFGFLGINALGYFPSTPRFDGVLQLAVVAANSWLALTAWSSRITVRPPARTRVRRPSPPRRRVAQGGGGPSKSWLEAVRARVRDGFDSLSSGVQSVLTAPRKLLNGRNSTLKLKKPSRAQKSARRKSAFRLGRARSHGVHLSQYVEHRCPYCLEVVEPNDKRGVRVCEVCHTPHHADCWEIAGVCQVPHEVA